MSYNEVFAEANLKKTIKTHEENFIYDLEMCTNEVITDFKKQYFNFIEKMVHTKSLKSNFITIFNVTVF
jgi:hypothetical protein